jgi:hypothetical protein
MPAVSPLRLVGSHSRHLLCSRISSLPPPATRTLRPQLGSKQSSLT